MKPERSTMLVRRSEVVVNRIEDRGKASDVAARHVLAGLHPRRRDRCRLRPFERGGHDFFEELVDLLG